MGTKDMANAGCDGLSCTDLPEENAEGTCQTGRSRLALLDFTALERAGLSAEKANMTCRTRRSVPARLSLATLTLAEKLEIHELSCKPEPEQDVNFVTGRSVPAPLDLTTLTLEE